MILTPTNRIWGEFTIQRRSNGGILLEELRFRNLITNLGLDLIGQGSAFLAYCRLSTSTATPAITDTTMGGTSVSTSTSSLIFPNSDSISASAPYTSTSLRGFRFNAGVATGTWASIGILTGATDGNVMAKTRIRDGGGTPTTITVLAGEILDIRYELRTEIDVADVTGTISGIGFTMRPMGVATGGYRTWSGFSAPTVALHAESGGTIALNAITSTTPFANSAQFSGGSHLATFNAYTNGTYTRSWTVTFGTAVTHASNTIRGIFLSGVSQFGFGWAFLLNSPGFTKTNLQTCTITGSISWGRA